MVWVATRAQIAEHFREKFPYQKGYLAPGVKRAEAPNMINTGLHTRMSQCKSHLAFSNMKMYANLDVYSFMRFELTIQPNSFSLFNSSRGAVFSIGLQLFPSPVLPHPLGHEYDSSYCHEKYGSVSFVNTSGTNLVTLGNFQDSSNTSLEYIEI